MAVSYTHLDVYKRQLYCSAIAQLGNAVAKAELPHLQSVSTLSSVLYRSARAQLGNAVAKAELPHLLTIGEHVDSCAVLQC